MYDNYKKARVAQVKSFRGPDLNELDETVNQWIIDQVESSKNNGSGYSTKNIEYMTHQNMVIGTVTYIVNLDYAKK